VTSTAVVAGPADITEGPILVSTTDGVTTLTFNRPELRNAIAPQTWTLLSQILDEVRQAHDLRVLVLAGVGKAFCAGADLSASGVDGAAERSYLHFMRDVGNVVRQLYHLPIPTVARVHGAAFGSGWNLALACDLVIASERARFCQVFTRAGVGVDTGGSWLLPRLVGMQQAKDLVLLAREVSAAQAHAMGLVTQVVEPDALDAAVQDVVGRLAAGPPIALSLSKAMLNATYNSSLDESLENEARSQTIVVTSEDGAEAFAAFQDKRPPRFVGR
jgi:enoyl-CoA hydratase/carnithine racemase